MIMPFEAEESEGEEYYEQEVSTPMTLEEKIEEKMDEQVEKIN